MSNICKTVTLRTRKIKGGEQLSYYLDYYPGYRDESTMKVMRHESLGIYIYTKPKNQRERDYNDRMREKAEALRCRRFESIVNERYDFFDIPTGFAHGVVPRQVPSGGQGGAGRVHRPRLLHREAPFGRRSGLPLVVGRHARPHLVGDLGHQ